eukprot:24400_1
MMKFIKIFTNKVNNRNCECIIDIIRCKNGWSVYNSNYPQYTDIKLNVLIQSQADKNRNIIAEIQFLVSTMSSFKKVSHKMYSIERKAELCYNFAVLANEMKKFKDIAGGVNEVIIHLVQNDDIKSFKLLWKLIKYDYNTLIDYNTLDKNVWNT